MLSAQWNFNFRCGGTSNVALFKAFAEIPNSKNICQELYSILHEPPCDVPKLGPISEALSMNEYRKTIISHYLKWRLEFPADQDKLLKLVTSKLLYKSFANIKNSFDVLHYDYELPIEIVSLYFHLKLFYLSFDVIYFIDTNKKVP